MTDGQLIDSTLQTQVIQMFPHKLQQSSKLFQKQFEIYDDANELTSHHFPRTFNSKGYVFVCIVGLRNSYSCSICNVVLNSIEQYYAHLQGSKHQNK